MAVAGGDPDHAEAASHRVPTSLAGAGKARHRNIACRTALADLL
jgi:hypothetical protein